MISYLLPQIIQDEVVLAIVAGLWTSFLEGLSDLMLQFAVLLFQLSHRLQIGSQAVIQILHMAFLIAHDVPPRASAHACRAHLEGSGGRNAPASRGRTERHGRGRGDPRSVASRSAIRASGTMYGHRAGEGDVRCLRCVVAHGVRKKEVQDARETK